MPPTGSAGLHAGEALHGLAGHRPHHRLVAVHQRLHQHVRHLFGRQRLHPAAGRAVALALAHLLLHLAPHLVDVGSSPSLMLVLGAAQAEVDLEHRLERPPVGVVLHHRGAERVLERLAVLDRDVLHRLHRVEVLGERHRQPRVAQLDDEAVEQVRHSVARRGRGHCAQATGSGSAGSPRTSESKNPPARRHPLPSPDGQLEGPAASTHRVTDAIAVQGASFLVLVVLAATVAFIPVGSDWYQGAMAAIGAVATVAAIGLGVVGLAADHARQRIYATLDFVNGLLEQDREGIANVHRWVKQSGVVVLSAEQDADLRRNPDLSRLHDDLRNYLNHLERLSLGVRMGIFDGDLLHRLMFTRVVNARRRYGAYIDSAASDPNLAGRPTSRLRASALAGRRRVGGAQYPISGRE